jgi:XTP/dITP diphosphohydrolase
MMQKLLIGTHNKGKLKEYQEMFAALPLELVGLDEVGLAGFEAEEPADTFAENALLKARAYAEAAGMVALGDDSGLCVVALGGAPGVYSARYAGKDATDAQRRAKLLGELAHFAGERAAYFMCVTVVYDPHSGQTIEGVGRVDGQIALAESNGGYGFGYDPIFIPDGHSVTFGDLPPAVKHPMSHRGRALEDLRPRLLAWFSP